MKKYNVEMQTLLAFNGKVNSIKHNDNSPFIRKTGRAVEDN